VDYYVLSDHPCSNPAQQYCDLAAKQLHHTFRQQDYNAFVYWPPHPSTRTDYYHTHSMQPPTERHHPLQRYNMEEVRPFLSSTATVRLSVCLSHYLL